MADECQSCNRPIIWVTSPSGARMPVDARPVTVYALDTEIPNELHLGTTTPAAIKVLHVVDRPGSSVDGSEADKVYISHFVTCPQAADWSGRRRADGRS